MTGASGGADPCAGPGRRWDVTLSFAGAQRDYVGQVAGALKAREHPDHYSHESERVQPD